MEEWKEGKKVIYYKSVVTGLLWSNPDDLTFTLRRRKAAYKNGVMMLIRPDEAKIVEETFEAMSWKDAKRVAYTLIKLES